MYGLSKKDIIPHVYMYGKDDKESNDKEKEKNSKQVTPFVSSGVFVFVFVFRALMIKSNFISYTFFSPTSNYLYIFNKLNCNRVKMSNCAW